MRLREQRPPHTFSPLTSAFVHNPKRTAGMLDRLTFAGNIIETGTTSYRLAHARA